MRRLADITIYRLRALLLINRALPAASRRSHKPAEMAALALRSAPQSALSGDRANNATAGHDVLPLEKVR